MDSDTSPSLLWCGNCGNSYLDNVPVPSASEFPDSRTNKPANSGDIAAIQADVDVRQREIQALQAQIALLKRTMQALESRQRLAEEGLRKNKAILHPIRALPTELLREIFRHCTKSQVPACPGIKRSPHNLSFVSQQWRQISITFPELWTTIVLDHAKVSGAMIASMVNRSRFNRSTAALLDIKIGHGYNPSSLENLISSSRRWQTLKLETMYDGMPLLQPVKGRLDSLRELSLRVFPAEVDIPAALDFFELAPLLRKVELIDDCMDDYPAMILPWTTISSLTVRGTSPMSLESLALCQNLTILRLYTVHRHSTQQMRAMSFSKLRTLHIGAAWAEDPDIIASILNKLTTPALETLDLRAPMGDPSDTAMTSLVRRSGCSLTELRLTNIIFSQTSMSTFLSSSPAITRLVVSYSKDIVPLLTIIPGANSVLVPKLTRLVLGCEDDMLTASLQMLESRLAPSEVKYSELVKVRLDIGCQPDASQSSRVQALQATGLQLTINPPRATRYTYISS
ncbi:hypothetical protein C8J56DRAFT_1168319 [Mycena floridula]|nr:hypothetical protein C8J56DRAFT_1168319 [Mycena floridula]